MFINEGLENFFAFDSKFFSSLRLLVRQPGQISKDYISGIRQRYLSPMRIYLIISVIFFLSQGMEKSFSRDWNKGYEEKSIPELTKDVDPEKTMETVDSILLEEGPVKITINPSAQADSSMWDKPKSDNKFIANLMEMYEYASEHPDDSPQTALDSLKLPATTGNLFTYHKIHQFSYDYEEVFNYVMGKLSLIAFLFLPLFAIFMNLIYFRHDILYMEHLVFVFHVQSVGFVILTLTNIMEAASQTLGVIFLLLASLWYARYIYKAMRVFYKQSKWKTIFKWIIIYFGYFTLLGLTFVLSFLVIAMSY